MPEFPPRSEVNALDTERILRALNDGGVSYVLIGGVACIMHGAEQTTFDADVLPELNVQNLQRLLTALGSLNAGVLVDAARMDLEDGAPWETESLRRGEGALREADAWHFTTDAGPVDVVMTAAGVGDFEAHVHNSRELEVFGIRVRIAGIDDIVRSKEFLAREKDLLVLGQLRRIRDMGGA